MGRKEIARLYQDAGERGVPAPSFVPDFSFDNQLYEELDSLNEISIALSQHSLSQACQVRLQEVPTISSMSSSDNVLFDNIPDKNMDVSELLYNAHQYEHDVLNEMNNQNSN